MAQQANTYNNALTIPQQYALNTFLDRLCDLYATERNVIPSTPTDLPKVAKPTLKRQERITPEELAKIRINEKNYCLYENRQALLKMSPCSQERK